MAAVYGYAAWSSSVFSNLCLGNYGDLVHVAPLASSGLLR